MKNRLRLWLGSRFQLLAWWLCDPHDSWSINYRRDGKHYAVIRKGPYSLARAAARELGGVIDGCRAEEIPAEDGQEWLTR